MFHFLTLPPELFLWNTGFDKKEKAKTTPEFLFLQKIFIFPKSVIIFCFLQILAEFSFFCSLDALAYYKYFFNISSFCSGISANSFCSLSILFSIPST